MNQNHDAVTEEDEIMVFMKRVLRFVLTYKYHIAGLVSAAFIIAIGSSAYFYYSNRAEDKASAVLARTVSKYENTDNKNAYTDMEKELTAVIAEIDGTDAAGFATLKLADTYYKNGNYDQAAQFYRKAANDFSGAHDAKNIALRGLAYSLAEKKDYEGAAKHFEALLEDPNAIMKDSILLNLGNIYEKMGETEKSRDAFQKIQSEHAESIYAKLVKEKLNG